MHSLRIGRAIRLGALLASLLLASTAGAQTSSQPTAEINDRVDVRVINVEVVVTDKQGVRAHGLEPEDFRLLVDGEHVPIDFFTEVRGGDALAQSGQSPTVSPISAGQAMGTSYLVFIDDYFTIGADRRRVLDHLRDELPYLGHDDRMAIVSWDGTGLDMMSSWSSSVRTLERALLQAQSRPAYGLSREAEERQAEFASPMLTRAHPFARRFDVGRRAHADRLAGQVERLVEASSAALRGFASPPGRKVMILVSGGWPYSPAEYAAGNALDPVLEWDYDRGREFYQPLVETANLLGYTLYPVDAPGLERTSGVDASNNRLGVASLNDREFFREWEEHRTLQFLAQETGGVALLNSRSNTPLSRVVEDTRSFYWLGFTPERLGDDAIQTIEVELSRKGYRVRSRSSFRDLSPRSEVAMAVESSLLFGDAADASLDLEVGAGRKLRWGKVERPLLVRIPADRITLLPVGRDEDLANLEVRIAVRDRFGNLSEVPSLPLAVRSSELSEDADFVEVETTLKMRTGEHELVVAVHDTNTGELLQGRRTIGP